VSLQQIASSTKVSIGMLEALERDDPSRLPGGVFARGFVRSYAAAVGLDPSKTLAEFVEQSPLPSVKDGYPPASQVERIERPEAEQVAIRIHPRQRPTALQLATVLVLAGGLAAYLATTKRWPWAVPHKSAQAAHGSRTDSAAVTAPPALAPQNPPEPPEPVTAPAPAVTTTEPVPSPDAVAAVPLVPEPPPAKPLDVVLSATTASWVIVTLDGQKILSRMFEAGDEEALEVHRELIVTAGDAAAIAMTIDGVPARPLGASHQTVTAHIDRTNYRAYLADGPSPDTP
jgi:cytoskeleton protein RodZ